MRVISNKKGAVFIFIYFKKYPYTVMDKILQARLQQYMNHELPYVQAGFRKGRGTRDQIANIFWNMELPCFFDDPADVGNLISGSSAFSKTSLNIGKVTVHVLLKPGWRILSITLLTRQLKFLTL